LQGQAFLNGYNLGRYWPAMGPQVTLYVPKGILRPYPSNNKLILLELQQIPCLTKNQNNKKFGLECIVEFIDHEVLNGTTPINDT